MMSYYVGQSGEYVKTITETDIYSFAELCGDYNPVHVDKEFAEKSFFGKQVSHGILILSLCSTVIGTIMPGNGTIYLSQNSKFLKPVYIGDTVKAVITIASLEDNNRAILKTEVFNQYNEVVIAGEAKVILPVKEGE